MNEEEQGIFNILENFNKWIVRFFKKPNDEQLWDLYLFYREVYYMTKLHGHFMVDIESLRRRIGAEWKN